MKSLYWKLITTRGEERAILRFLRRSGAEPSSRILDVGCGYGRNLKSLHNAGYRPVGVEIASQTIETVRKQGFICLQPDDPSLRETPWDVILMSHFIEHFEPVNLLNVMDDYLDMLRDEGFLIIATPLPHRGFWDNFDHIKPYTPPAIEEVFGLPNYQVQFQSKNKLELIYLWLRRRPLQKRYSASLLKGPITLGKIALGLFNIFLRLLHFLSLRAIGVTDGWVGLYKKMTPVIK